MGISRWIVLLFVFLVSISLVNADLISEVGDADRKARDFTYEYNLVTVIVEGKYSTTLEKFAVSNARARSGELNSKPIIKEEDVKYEDLKGFIVLVGGPMQNSHSARIIEEKTSSEFINLPLGYVELVKANNLSAVIISDRSGYSNFPRTNAYNSPLAKFMPVAFVPFFATFIAIFLIWAWNLITKISGEGSKSTISKNILKFAVKKPIQPDFLGFHLGKLRIKYREWFAIGFSAVIFALAISYSYYISRPDIAVFILFNIAVNFFINSIKHFIRLLVDAHRKFHTEYSLWHFGIFLTLFSGWLGNVFGVAGYTQSEGNDKREGLSEFLTTIVMFFISIFALVANYLNPTPFLQMVGIISLTGSFLSMLPMIPFDGRKIYSWNKLAWWLTFIPLLIVYVCISLVV